jgi:hypothetical protein
MQHLSEVTIATFESSHKMRELAYPEASNAASKEYSFDEQHFHLRLANSEKRREAASLLIKKMYSWRGYSVEDPLAHQPNRITLVVDDKAGNTVGTMSLCLDSEYGLPADENYRDKLDELRALGRRLCEPSKLAIERHLSYRVFASMMHTAYIYSHKIQGYTDYVIEVNPRHAAFYKKMLGFHDFGELRTCTRVNAPAVLLRLEGEYMGEQIEKFGGMFERHGEEKSFYPYFFPPGDAHGITERLRNGKN